jgi:uncharacterized protein YggL (DUF469 family)
MVVSGVWCGDDSCVSPREIDSMTAPCPTFGFAVMMTPRTELGSAEGDRLWDDWVAFLESRGLYCAGGGGESLEYVVASEASQATDSDRRAVEAWLGARAELRAWRVGELIDLSQAV